MPALEKISTLEDMKSLLKELKRLEAKFLFDFYGVFQDFSSKKLLPQWLLNKKLIKNTIISESGNDILKRIGSSNRLSVVFYDLETPDLNGLQFMAAITQQTDVKERCKVILATPKLATEVQNKLFDMGVAALVCKPLEEESLKVAMEKIGLDY